MKKNIFCYFLILIPFFFYGQHDVIDLSSALEDLGNIEKLPSYRDDTKVLQISSYDTTGGNDDGFSGNYSYLRKTPDSTLVIFDVKGKGVINRIWTPTPTQDTLDFYLDGTDKPSYSVNFSDLFSGKVFPFVAPLSGNELGGYYSYVPIPYDKGCKIVLRGKKLQFYQIQYRTLPDAYSIKSFSQAEVDSSRDAFDKLKANWKKVSDPSFDSVIKTDTILKPGERITVAHIKKGGRIEGLKIYNAEAYEGMDKKIDLMITWDNEQNPGIYAPVSDFFGYAFGHVSMQGLLMGSKEGTDYCFLPMPFDKSAKIELKYRASDDPENDRPIALKTEVMLSQKARKPKEEGKFYAFWQKDTNAVMGKPHTFLQGKGKGHYVGTILQAQGLDPGMTLFFEGDDVTTIDGEMRMHGTGSEDYFNGGWYALLDRWDGKASLPLHGALDYSLPYSRTGGYRFFILDKMPFNNEITHTIEHGPENNNVPVDYTSVALYYAQEAVSKNQQTPDNALTSVYLPKTFMIYPQLMRYSFLGNAEIMGNSIKSTTGALVRIDISELPKGDYDLYADIEKSPDGATTTLWQRQHQVGDPISFYAPEKTVENKILLAPISIDDFKKTITFKFKEDQDKSRIIINRLILIKK